ncbi:MAG: UDP-3-O-(3-hydroxymyristoyl)glucosamine N-acyltransferase [Ignavibacteriaceae bacterium]
MKQISIREIADRFNGKILGDENLHVSNVARIEEAQKGDLTFLYLPVYEKYFPSTKASAIIVKRDFNKTRDDITYIEVDVPEKTFREIIINFFGTEVNLEGIDKTAFVHKDAKLGSNASIGKNVVISAGCKIGNNVKIFHNTVILENVELGDDVIVYQNVSIREKCIIGNRVTIHAGTVIGADGFGYTQDENKVYHKIPQIGNVVIEDDVEIGANTTVDRAAMGSTVIKRGSKIDNLVQVAHNVVIGEDTVIAAQAGVSGSSKIGNRSILAGQVGIAGHLEIGDNVVLIAQSGVSKSILKPGYYFGAPAKELKTAFKLEAHIRNLPEYSEKLEKLEKEVKQLKEQLANTSKQDKS